jgi:hypothetical protein
MRLLKWPFLFLLIHSCANQLCAQTPAPIYYYWVSKDSVYCWRSKAGDPVVASLSGRTWSLKPDSARRDQQWLKALTPLVPSNTLPSEVWVTFLKTLREQPLNASTVPWYPDAQLYLRYQTPDSVLVTFIKSEKSETIGFAKKGQKWEPVSKNILSELSLTLPAINVVLGPEIPVTDSETAAAAWNDWISASLENQNTKGPRRYLNPDNTPGWIWQEALIENDWNRRLSLPKPSQGQEANPTGSAATGSPYKDGENTTHIPFYGQWWFWVVVDVIAFLLIIWMWRKRATIGARILQWRKSREPDLRHKAKSHSKKKTASSRTKGTPPIQTFDRGDGLEKVCEDYIEVAEQSVADLLEKLRSHVESERSRIIEEYNLVDLAPEKVTNLIDLGTEAELCYDALQREQALPNHTSDLKLYPGKLSKIDWLSQLPNSVVSIDLAMKEQEAWRAKHDSEQQLRSTLERDLSDTRGKLEQLSQKAKGDKALTEKQVTDLSTQLEQQRRKSEDLEASIDGIGKTITSAATYIHQGLRYYIDQSDNPAYAAVVAALINYSLFKLCTGMATQDNAIRDAMLVNLHSISSKMSAVYGFKSALEEIEKAFPGIGSATALTRSTQSHPDDKLFQLLLKYIRDYAQLDLAPFYFAVDKDKKVHYAN